MGASTVLIRVVPIVVLPDYYLQRKGDVAPSFFGMHLDDMEGEKQKRCFEGINSSQEDLILKLKFCVPSWVSYLPDFWGLSFDAIIFNWREIPSP